MSCCDPGRACQLLQYKIAKRLFFLWKRLPCVHISTSTSSGFNGQVPLACNWGKRNLTGHVVQQPLQFSCRRRTIFPTLVRFECVLTIILSTYHWRFLVLVLPYIDYIIYESILIFTIVVSLLNNNISKLHKISPGCTCTTRPYLYMSKILDYDDLFYKVLMIWLFSILRPLSKGGLFSFQILLHFVCPMQSRFRFRIQLARQPDRISLHPPGLFAPGIFILFNRSQIMYKSPARRVLGVQRYPI